MKSSWLTPFILTSLIGCVVLTAQNAPALIGAEHLAISTSQTSQIREWDRRIDQLSRSGELRRRSTRHDTVIGDGRVHVRYDQFFGGVRVIGGDIVRQERDGVTGSIFGVLHGGIDISPTPSITEDDALAAFRQLSSRELRANARPELVILPRDEGGFALTWRTHVWTDEGLMHVFLDAASGAIHFQYSDLQTQGAVGTGTGVLGDRKKISTRAFSGRFLADDQLRPPMLVTYDMQGNLLRTQSLLGFGLIPTANDVANDSDNVWADPPNVDAHVHLGWTYDFLFKRFGRKGLDDRDVPIRAITHPVRLSDAFTASPAVLDTYYGNAFWCGSCGPEEQGMMVFGEGIPAGFTWRGAQYRPLAGALDVAAHELTHGLTTYSSNLIYRNESGALNEAFSDIIGTSVEFFFHPAGSGPGRADYLLGEDVVVPSVRSMADPRAFQDRDHYSNRFLGSADNGGVHTNSGIANNAFYLAIEGGSNRTSGLEVQGVGGANREQIEKSFYRAFVFLLPSNATFSSARAATIQSARDLYGNNSAAERAITQAWTAVGVF